MRKFKALALTVLILSLPVAAFPAAGVSAREFSDVPITASYYTAVDKLSNIGVIQGREDGNFAPDAQTTRAEFCAFLSRATGYNENYYQASTTPFTDVSADYWANSYISYCYDRGYINGNLDNTFAPADPVTYEQVVKMVVCSSGAGDDSLRSVGPYWYSGYLAVADKYGLGSDDIQLAELCKRWRYRRQCPGNGRGGSFEQRGAQHTCSADHRGARGRNFCGDSCAHGGSD